MGMYTEFFFRAELKKDAPDDLVVYLRKVLDPSNSWYTMTPYNDHEFFTCERWQSVFWSSSYSHPPGDSKFHASDGIRPSSIVIHSSLKNYGGEAGAFVDWIMPYINACPGDFLGYTLYEDSRPSGWYSDVGPDVDRPGLIFMPAR